MGQRKDGRLFFPGNDILGFRGRQQMDVLEAGGVLGSFPKTHI
jgi:hypothetical protein